MAQLIIYKMADSTYRLSRPVVGGLSIDQVATKDMPAGAQSYTVADENALPLEVVSYIAAQQAVGPTVMSQLVDIDQKKVRAITDAVLLGDQSRLQQLEQQAALLRPHVGG